MNTKRNQLFFLVAILVVCTFGCSESPPDLVPLTAIVKTAEGVPLSHLKLRMIPQDSSLDGNFIASGVTDDDGKCILKLPGRQESAIPACPHKILIVEAPQSKEARAAYMGGDPSVSENEMKERKGRPISTRYSRLQETPLIIEVSADKPEIEIILEK